MELTCDVPGVLISSVFLYCSPLGIWGQVLSLNLELGSLVRLARR